MLSSASVPRLGCGRPALVSTTLFALVALLSLPGAELLQPLSFSVELTGSATAAAVKANFMGSDLRLWCSVTAHVPQDRVKLGVTTIAGGVRLTFTLDATSGATPKSLAASVGAGVSQRPQATLDLLMRALRAAKLDLGVASLTLGGVKLPFAYVPPRVDAAATRFTGPGEARVVLTWAATNRPVGSVKVTLEAVDGSYAKTQTVAGPATGFTFAGVGAAAQYRVKATVTDAGGRTSNLGKPFLLAGPRAPSSPSPAPVPPAASSTDLATAVRFTSVIDGLTLAQNDAQLLEQYKEGIAAAAPNTAITVTIRKRARAEPTYGNVILDTLVVFPPGPQTEYNAETFGSLLGRRNYFVYGMAQENKYGDLFGDVAHLEALLPPYKVMADGSDPPQGAYPFLEPALLMTVAVHDLNRHTQSMMDQLTTAIQAKISAMTKVPAVATGTLFTDLLTAASPELTPCSSVQVASADVAALRALSDLATKTPASIFDPAALGVVDIREFSAQIRMVVKAAA